jgi:hypothetical protein
VTILSFGRPESELFAGAKNWGERDMIGFERAGWLLAYGNFAVFAIVCGITLICGGLDPAVMG